MRGTTLVHGCALSLFNAELRFALPIERIASRPCSTQIYIYAFTLRILSTMFLNLLFFSSLYYKPIIQKDPMFVKITNSLTVTLLYKNTYRL